MLGSGRGLTTRGGASGRCARCPRCGRAVDGRCARARNRSAAGSAGPAPAVLETQRGLVTGRARGGARRRAAGLVAGGRGLPPERRRGPVTGRGPGRAGGRRAGLRPSGAGAWAERGGADGAGRAGSLGGSAECGPSPGRTLLSAAAVLLAPFGASGPSSESRRSAEEWPRAVGAEDPWKQRSGLASLVGGVKTFIPNYEVW